MASLFRKRLCRRPPDGLSEICERVYVFDYCYGRAVLEGEEYGLYLRGVVGRLHNNFPEASFTVFNFREGESQIAGLLHEYNMMVMDYPCQYGGCPPLPMEMIHHLLKSCENWLSLGQQNVVLMNCEQCGWPVLAFMMAALLSFRTKSMDEHRVLDMIYKRAPRKLLQLNSLLNPFPCQLRYLQYIARRKTGQEWPPVYKALTLDCIILQYYKQVGCGLLKIDIGCHIKGDAMLSYKNDPQQEAVMLRVMFNTAFIKSNIPLDAEDQFPEYFKAEVIFPEMDAANSHISANVPPTIEEKDGTAGETSMKVQESFSATVRLSPKSGLALNKVDQHLSASKLLLEDVEARLSESVEKAGVCLESDVGKVEEESVLKASKDKCMKPSLISMWKQSMPSIQQSLDAIRKMSEVQDSKLAHQPSTDGNTIRKKMEHGEPQAALLASSQCVHAFTASDNAKKLPVVSVESKKYAPPFKPSSDETSNRKKMEATQVHVALQLPAQSKLMSQSKLNTSISLPASNCSSLQGSPGPISRFHGAASVLGITALLHDHAASNKDATHTVPPISSTSSSSALTSMLRPLHVAHVTTPPSPLPPLPLSQSSKQDIGESCSEKKASTTPSAPLPLRPSMQPSSEASVIKRASAVPPPPPPPDPAHCPPQTTLKDIATKCLQKTLHGEGNLSSATPAPRSLSNLRTSLVIKNLNSTTPSPPPPPPPIRSSPSLFVKKASQASFTGPQPQPQPPPPPPPPSPSSLFQVSPYSTSRRESLASSRRLDSTSNFSPSSLHPQKSAPPPPPPPLNPSPRTIPSAPPPPPPPRSSAKGSLPDILTLDPPVPSAPAPSKPGDVFPKTDSGVSNCSAPAVAGMASATFNSKGQGASRPCSKYQAQTKKANLKPYHWLKLTRAMQGSLWAEAQHPDEASKAPEFDMSELESLFSATLPNSDNGISARKSNRRLSGPRSEKVQLIELRRAYNCEIMLSKVKIPLPELTSLVLALDDSALDIDQVENLIKYCPSKEEMELLKGYNGCQDNLGKCELFFLELMKVPRIESKLRVFLFKSQFHSQVSELKRNLNVINSAVQEVKNSVKLKRIMHTILILGNALNHGTARGSAIGFRLDSLLKLTDTRSRNCKMTLMHYLCKVLAEKLPELLDFPKDLVSLEAATKIQLKFLAEEMQAISKGIEKVVLELTASETDGHVSDGFRKTLKEFLSTAQHAVRSLASLYSTAGRNADLLALYFGEDPARCTFEQVVSTLLNFVKMFVQAHEENCKQLEFERKKGQKDAVNETERVNFPRRDSEHMLQSFIRNENIIC